MKFLAVWLRWWVGAVLAGIAAAVLAGLCETFPLTAISVFEENNYLGYHLFATAVQSLALTIDRWLPEMIGLALLLAAALQAGARGRGKVRPFLRVGLPMLALGAVAIYHFHHYPSHWYMVTTTVKAAATFCWHFLLTPLGLLLPLALLAWIEWRILRARRRTTGPDTAEGKREQAAARRASALRRSLRLLRFPSYAALGLLLVLFIALHAAWGLYRWRAQGALRGKPNIIFIMVDTLRVDHVGCYGYDLPTTPNIDRFAKTSTRFANPISQASWTPWSVNSLFTSQYPDLLFASRLDVLEKLQIDLQGGIAPTYGAPLGFTTLAEVLRDRGYSTSAVVANIGIGANPGNTQGYAYYCDAPAKLMSKTSPDLTRLAIARLQKVKDAPFFMFLSYMDPHFPYDQHPGFTFGESRRDRSVERGLSHTIEKTQLVARRQGLRRYDSEIAYTDDSIGQFLEALKTQGLFDDALIVFSAITARSFASIPDSLTGGQSTRNSPACRLS